jgi:hypothetical protein
MTNAVESNNDFGIAPREIRVAKMSASWGIEKL